MIVFLVNIIVFILLLLSYLLSNAFQTRKEYILIYIITTISIILMISAMFKIISIASIIIICILFIFLIIAIIKTYKAFKTAEFLTPSFVLIILTCIFYSIATYKFQFHEWDEASLYATSVKKMFFTGELSLGGILSYLSYFFIRITGFNEGVIYISRFFYIVSMFSIFLANIKWKKWISVLLICIIFICMISIISSTPLYRMDIPLGVAFGVAISLISQKHHKHVPLILTVTSVNVILLKDLQGIIFYAILTLYLFFDLLYEYYYRDSSFLKQKIVIFYLVGSMFSIILGSLIEMFNPLLNTIKNIFQVNSLLLLLIIFVSMLLFGVLLYYFTKLLKKIISENKIFMYLLGIGIVFLIVLLYSLACHFINTIPDATMINITNKYKYIMNLSFFHVSIWHIIILMPVLSIILEKYIIRKDKTQGLIFNGVLLTVLLIVYSAIVLAMLLTEYKYFPESAAYRYIVPFIIAIIIWVLSTITDDEKINNSRTTNMILLIILVLSLQYLPTFGEKPLYLKSVEYTSYIDSRRPYAEECARIIESNTIKPGKVVVVSQKRDSHSENEYGINHWINYSFNNQEYTVINNVAGFSANKNENRNTSTNYYTTEQFSQMLSSADYVFIVNADEQFWIDYGSFFEIEDGFWGLYYVEKNESNAICTYINTDK